MCAPRPVHLAKLTPRSHHRLRLRPAAPQLPEWVGRSPLAEWNATERLGLLNLKYDAMPADFVSVVVTEVRVCSVGWWGLEI